VYVIVIVPGYKAHEVRLFVCVRRGIGGGDGTLIDPDQADADIRIALVG